MSHLRTKEIPLSKLMISKYNVRVGDKKLPEGFVESIRTKGLMNPLIVLPCDEKGIYPVIAGGRRLRALNQIYPKNKDKVLVDCRVESEMQDVGAMSISLSENHHREAPSVEDYKKMINAAEAKGIERKAISKMLNISEAYISQLMVHGSASAAKEAQRKERIAKGTKVQTIRIMECPSCHVKSRLEYGEGNVPTLVLEELVK